MKKVLTILGITALVLAAPSALLANGLGAGIAGSPHDFSAETWNHRGELWRVCHVPHDHDRNDTLFANGLLWDHQVSAATYEMYPESFPSFIDGAFDAEPTGVSKLCLGCHDGTVGVDQFDNKTGLAGTVFIDVDYNPGYQVPGGSIPDIGADKNMTGTHPLSIAYDNINDTGLHDPATTAMGASGMINDVLWNGQVHCSTCHDVHDSPGESVPATHLLRVANNTATGTASGLCLTCHDK